MSLLQQFSQGQTRVGRERSSAVQDSLTHYQTSSKHFQVTGQHLLGSHSAFEIRSFTLATQESLVSTADSLLTMALRPLLTGLSKQLTLQSSLLSQSTASLKTQVTQHWAVDCSFTWTPFTMYMYVATLLMFNKHPIYQQTCAHMYKYVEYIQQVVRSLCVTCKHSKGRPRKDGKMKRKKFVGVAIYNSQKEAWGTRLGLHIIVVDAIHCTLQEVMELHLHCSTHAHTIKGPRCI